MDQADQAQLVAKSFSYFRRGSTEVWIRKGCEEALLPDGERYVERMLPRMLSAARDVLMHKGRGTAVSFPVIGMDGRVVVRHYHHGGFLRHLTGDLFWSRPPRPYAELAVSEEARALGVTTPEVVAAIVRWITPVLYRGDLITREVTDSRDLLEFFGTETDFSLRRRALASLAKSIREMHERQLYHQDLNIRNVLLGQDGGAWILDLDGAQFFEILGSRRIKENLLRLSRSMRKEKMEVSDREVLYFLYAYYGEDFRDVYSEEYSAELLCQKSLAD